jgi:hypothetical protein
VVGIWGGIAGLAVAGGPLVGGAVAGAVLALDLLVNVPIGFAAAIASVRLLPESYGPTRRLDLPALPLIAGASLALTWGLVRAGGSGWGDGFTVALLAGGAAVLAGYRPALVVSAVLSLAGSAAAVAISRHRAAVQPAPSLNQQEERIAVIATARP